MATTSFDTRQFVCRLQADAVVDTPAAAFSD